MGTAPDLEEVAAIVRRHLPRGGAYRAYLFGSRATRRARPVSDWDIGVLGPAPMRGAVLQAIRDELDDLRTLHTFDVVDLAAVPEGFRAAALHDAVQLA
jgi:predicted nucleotidyltransferase